MMSGTTYIYAKIIVDTLKQHGFTAYYAGGWVRDYLMGHPSDDIDIATDAPPEKILALFPRTIKVGLAFGIVVVAMEGHQFEVATFRKDIDYIDGRKPSRIEPATAEEDAQRRDFTINGLFFNPDTETIIDYVGGKADIEKKIIRSIGEPYNRFFEDRLRMIRAVRFAARFQFHIEEETRKAIAQNAFSLFPSVSMERIWHEFKKMAQRPNFDYALLEMARLNLLGVIFPELEHVHLTKIKEKMAHFAHFPKDTPAIAYIIEIFPEKTLQDAAELCRCLKAGNREIKFATLLDLCKKLVKDQQVSAINLARFYVQPQSELCLQIVAARFPSEEREHFLREHQVRREALAAAIERLRSNTPLVNSHRLRQEGITPGRLMGALLKEAERIAAEQALNDPDEVVRKLKATPLWPA